MQPLWRGPKTTDYVAAGARNVSLSNFRNVPASHAMVRNCYEATSYVRDGPVHEAAAKGSRGHGVLRGGMHSSSCCSADPTRGAEKAQKEKSHKISENPLDGRVSLGHPARCPDRIALFCPIKQQESPGR